ncbi:MAG: DUF1273 family protein [Clostridia bacterium]|nr:DUF1273 family protein [Clostridia bacterium]
MDTQCLRPEETVCFTGHRVISDTDMPRLLISLDHAITESCLNGYRSFLCGGARGFDTVAAEAVLRCKRTNPEIRLIIAVPCRTQADRWSVSDKEKYRMILDQADQVIVLSESYYEGCMHRRNRFMVDHSSLCLCYLIHFSGGTWYTVRYAFHQGIAINNLAVQARHANVLKENPWNFIYTSRSAKESVSIVHLCHSRQMRIKRKNTLMLLSGKRRKDPLNLQNR